jgi:2,4'-dihydroxyacetophenone dioxygenase
VHAFNLAGTREIFGAGERVGPGNYVYEPAGTADEWGATGDEPCVVHIKVAGTIDYLGENGQVIDSVNAQTQRAVYLDWCREHDVLPAEQILG